MKKYEHKKIEEKWQKKWAEKNMYEHKDDQSKEKYYVLDMFPYPSGDGLHMGHTESYTASDIIYRYKKLQGFDVLHPQGFDSFGLPAENYAIKTGVHPKETTETNASNYIKQMKMLGLGHDLDHLVYTSDLSYYKWTQWLFGKFFENGLVEQKTDKINWCPSCNTGIANEQVEDGKCERCKTEIEQKEVPGWFFKITDFAEDLINDLDKVDWPEATKKNQKAWIGRSEGAKIKFEIRNSKFEMNDEILNDENEKSNVVLVHGCPSDKEKEMEPETRTYDKHWQPWIKKELEKRGVEVSFPLMPYPWTPIYEEHKKEFEKLDINENSILVGHSCGANFLVRWLSETGQKIKKLILVAPWNEPSHKNKIKAEFYNISEVDYSFKNNISEGVIIFTSDNEEKIGKDTAKMWTDKLDAKLIELKDHGHYTEGEMGTTEFPELLEEVLQTDNQGVITDLEVFTTRPDTLFGATYLVVAPEHLLIKNKELKINNYNEVREYINKAKNKTEMERLESKSKTGVKLEGLMAVNPANGEEIPIFVADYVLGGYGTGAIMAVPAHDERDYAFASQMNAERTRKYAERTQTDAKKIEIRQVVAQKFVGEGENAIRKDKPMTERRTVDVIIKHWEKDEFFCLDWNKKTGKNWHSFVVGGVEEGETLEEAALREAQEETGYKNMRAVKQVGGEIHSYFYAAHKGVNRAPVKRNCIYLELTDGEWEEPAEEHTKNHDGVWVKKDKVAQVINLSELKIYWNIFIGKQDALFTGQGEMINSGQFDGMDSREAKKTITEFVGGEMTTNYRLRDWSISRQRYWGCPIPIVYSPEGKAKFVGEKNLPWLLPEDVDFVPTGTAPLAKSKELKERTEKLFGKGWTPEVDTMDTFVDSSWYFLRYPDPENEKEFCSSEKLKRWLPVDLYIGGAEHTYMHLLYARFFVKAMHKMGLIEFNEPFLKLRHQGMVLDKDGIKMSKSKGNVVNPNDMVEKFGADATRMYMMFAAPLDEEVVFKEEGVKGVYRFLEKTWKLFQDKVLTDCEGDCGEIPKELPVLLHKTIKGVTEDIEEMKFNTAISKLMIFINEFSKHEKVPRGAMEKFLILLSPFAPFIAEELWYSLRESQTDADLTRTNAEEVESIFNQEWPKYNPEMIKEEEIELVVQVNGKLRDKIKVSADISEEEAREKSLASEKIQKYTKGKEIRKVIFVKGKLINIVV